MARSNAVLVWMDLEMTGLDPDACAIIELAMVLTDHELHELAQPLQLTIWQPEAVLQQMTPFVRKMHEKSGLLTAVRASQVALEEAQRDVLKVLSEHAEYRTAPLCGNSVWQDRRFLERHMPAVVDYLHYRQIDVSTLKQLAKWWYNAAYPKPEDGKHTALFDVQQSIAELRYYRTTVLR